MRGIYPSYSAWQAYSYNLGFCQLSILLSILCFTIISSFIQPVVLKPVAWFAQFAQFAVSQSSQSCFCGGNSLILWVATIFEGFPASQNLATQNFSNGQTAWQIWVSLIFLVISEILIQVFHPCFGQRWGTGSQGYTQVSQLINLTHIFSASVRWEVGSEEFGQPTRPAKLPLIFSGSVNNCLQNHHNQPSIRWICFLFTQSDAKF